MLTRRLARFHERPLGHVPTTGNLARWLSAPWAIFFVVSSVHWLASPAPIAPASPKTPVFIAIASIFLLVGMFLLIRGAVLGAFVRRDRVVVRSWWRTWSFERGTGVSVSLAYWGGLLTGGWSGWPFWILTFTRGREDTAVEAQATLAFRRVNAAVMRELSYVLNAEDTGQFSQDAETQRAADLVRSSLQLSQPRGSRPPSSSRAARHTDLRMRSRRRLPPQSLTPRSVWCAKLATATGSK
jgi:hypothetical protein